MFVPVTLQAAKGSAEQNQITNDERNHGYAEKRVRDAWVYLDKGSTLHALRSLNSAKMYFSRISSAGQKSASNVALKARLDALAYAVDEQKTAKKDARQHKRTLKKVTDQLFDWLEQ